MQQWRLALSLLFLLLAFPLGARALPPTVYYSPADDGVDPGGAPQVPSLQPTTIHLYLDGGSTASPADPCDQGSGDEVCAWNLTIAGQGGLSAVDFTPDGDVVWSLSGGVLRATGIEALSGALGPVKIGDLVVDGSEGGTLELSAGESIDAALGVQTLATDTLVTLPEPGVRALLPAGVAALLGLGRRRARRGRGT